MSYSWFIFGRELPSFEGHAATPFPTGPWPGGEDVRDWDDLTSQLAFTPTYWAELPLANGGVPSEVWAAYELLARRIADAMHGVALDEDGRLLHIATSLSPMSQAAFDVWLSDRMTSALKAAKKRRATLAPAMRA